MTYLLTASDISRFNNAGITPPYCIVWSLLPTAQSQTSNPHDLVGGSPRTTLPIEISGTIRVDDTHGVLLRLSDKLAQQVFPLFF